MTFSWMTPHTTAKKSRDCVDCHNNSKSVGLGEGSLYKRGDKWLFEPIFIGKNLGMSAPLDACIDINGTAKVNFSRRWLRGFNKEEINRILNVGFCLNCHKDYSDKVMANWDRLDKDFCPFLGKNK